MSQYKDLLQFLQNGRRVHIFGIELNESKFHSGRNKEQVEVREC